MEEKYTRCPGCRTVFRVTPAQLALRAGQVRCGHCRTVFDGTAHLIQLAPIGDTAAAGHEDAAGEDARGPLTVTLRSAHALEPVTAMPQSQRAATPVAGVTPSAAAGENDEVDYDNRFAWDRPKKRLRSRTTVYVLAIIALMLAFVGQLAWHYRDLLAAHVPATRSALSRLCAFVGCAVQPLREVAGLSIDASDLQADPAHKGLLVLTATVRNRASYPVAFPHLELTLTDAQDQVVVRRALAPAEYAAGTTNVAAGIVGNGEVAIKLFLDASATTQSGYRVYLFYP
jgi:predicted Zn finger-like uncharacterized protein